MPRPVGKSRVGIAAAVGAFVREIDALTFDAKVSKMMVFFADEVAGGIAVFAVCLRGSEMGDTLAVGLDFAKDAVIPRVEGDFLFGNRCAATQVAQFGRRSAPGR